MIQRIYILIAITAMSTSLFSQAPPKNDKYKNIRIIGIQKSIKIDGNLTESVWELSSVATNFIQTDPVEGAPASERTEVRINSFSFIDLILGIRLC